MLLHVVFLIFSVYGELCFFSYFKTFLVPYSSVPYSQNIIIYICRGFPIGSKIKQFVYLVELEVVFRVL